MVNEGETGFDLLASYGLKVAKALTAKTIEEVRAAADEIGYPVALKIIAPVHKTEIGAVKLNVQKEQLEDAYNEIIKNAKKGKVKFEAMLVQEMAPPGGLEVIAGIKQDPQFGPVVLFGLGGVYTEIIKDVAIRVCPITKADASEMIEELKSKAIFSARGKKYSKSTIVDILMKTSDIAMKEEIKELDMNPIILYPEGSKRSYLVIDVRIIR